MNKMLIRGFRHLFIMIVLLSFTGFAEGKNDRGIRYYGRDHLLLEGTAIPDSLKAHPYNRLSANMKATVREPVWILSENTAGLSVRFVSNTTRLKVKWTLHMDRHMVHMAGTGIRGLDLYVKEKDTWIFVNSAKPTKQSNTAELVSNMPEAEREYRLYLPLYDGVDTLLIGIDSSAVIRPADPNPRKPLVFYGTSITQGGCASRPGMLHTSIISRALDVDCINLGFSGNGCMEAPISEFMTGIDASAYIIECLPNMTADWVTERTLPLVETLRKRHPKTPILLVDNFRYSQIALDSSMNRTINEKNAALKTEYQKIRKRGYKNVYYIDTLHARGPEGTVDGVHFTDLGFEQYARFLMKRFRKIRLKIKK